MVKCRKPDMLTKEEQESDGLKLGSSPFLFNVQCAKFFN